MSNYAKVVGGYVEYDFTSRKAEPFTKQQAQSELAAAQARLAEIPPALTNKELLAWARENYLPMDYSQEVAALNETVVLCNARLSAIQTLEGQI